MNATNPLAASVITRGSFLEELQIQYGPVDLLGRFFLKADEAALARGISLSFATFDQLLAINKANASSWKPIVTVFDPAYNHLGADNAFCIIGRNEAGDVVATQAARIYDLGDSSFFDEMQSLRFAYDHPERDKAPGESCKVSAQSSKAITGRVVFSGAVWYHPDYRKLDLAAILPRISRAYAYTRWDSQATTCLMAEAIFQAGHGDRAGYTLSDRPVRWDKSRIGDADLVFLWMLTDELLRDLSSFNATFVTEVHRQASRRRS